MAPTPDQSSIGALRTFTEAVHEDELFVLYTDDVGIILKVKRGNLEAGAKMSWEQAENCPENPFIYLLEQARRHLNAGASPHDPHSSPS